MSLLKNPAGQFFGLLILVFCSTAGAFTPSAQQIQQLKNLSPAEQRALAESYGFEIPQSTGVTAPAIAPATVPGPRVPRGENSDAQKNRVDENRARERGRDSGQRGLSQSRKASKRSEESERFTDINSFESDNLADEGFEKEQLERFDDSEQTDKDRDAVSSLQVTRDQSQALKPFGYELFAGEPTTFAPVDGAPIPVNYVVGPGDTVVIQLYGKENDLHEIPISREGLLQFPGIGPVAVNGLDFDELKQKIAELVKEQMIGVKANISMGALRSIQIFVLGEAYRPGAYTVSSLSTMTNALFVSGGITESGSLRNIQLKRAGKAVATLDLYDLLLNGDTSSDERLLPGDVLFIPPVGATAGIMGQVRRPAIYEFKRRATAAELVKLSGGYLPTAYPEASRIDRIHSSGMRTFIDLDLINNTGKSRVLNDGDVVQVYSILDKTDDAVLLSGHVNRPGGFEWKPGMRVSDLLSSISDLLPNADLGYALIKRETQQDRRLTTLQVDVSRAIKQKRSHFDVLLNKRDELIVFDKTDEREEQVLQIVDLLKDDADLGDYAKVVSVSGNVRFPGKYPLAENMSIRDLISASGGYKPATLKEYALQVSRSAQTSAIDVRPLALNDSNQLTRLLKSEDEVIVFSRQEAPEELLFDLLVDLKEQASRSDQQEIVSINGEVKFPGMYPLTNGMTVAQLISFAGGFKESAFLLQSDITRQHIDEKDEFYIEHFKIESQPGASLGEAYKLKNKDQVVISRIPNWNEQRRVTVTGQVKFPGTYPVSNGETLANVLKRAGGLSEFADPEAAIFLRKTLKEKEMDLLKTIEKRLQKDVIALKAEAATGVGTAAQKQARLAESKLLDEVKSVEPTGRLVIDLPRILSGKQDQNIALMDGDKLVVPTRIREVSIMGEVNFPTSHLYSKKRNVSEYIGLSGGVSKYADQKRTYIVRKDGSVAKGYKRHFFLFKSKKTIEPGDTIIVPMDADLMSTFDKWLGVSQILFQLATTAAALDTVGAL